MIYVGKGPGKRLPMRQFSESIVTILVKEGIIKKPKETLAKTIVSSEIENYFGSILRNASTELEKIACDQKPDKNVCEIIGTVCLEITKK